ncbi:MAG TPA: M50 family metallopeptidase, partial [Candidatus Angelobacter sp.]
MKLRGFVVGPFHWYVRDGRWEFQFRLSLLGGQTLVVPTTADFPRWRDLGMSAGGPLANVSTGLLALWVAIASKGPGLQYMRDALGLFATYSVVIGLANLLPVRGLGYYSDGAQIYQILSKGPWGDFHRAAVISASTLVTALRPRDYDIQTILRAAQGITRGESAMSLRLLSYTYFLDHDRFPEAGEALKEAGSIYEQCAAEVHVEVLTEFVFGSAYVLRDPAAARQWWTLMEARKPTRFNADYWRAASALHWIEGNLKEANEAWQKSDALAQKLPHTGAYEFDRDCCARLRNAIDESSSEGSFVALAKS